MSDRLVRAMVADGLARALWVDATGTVSEMLARHGLTGGAAEIGAQLAVANLLMSAWVKGEERVTLQLQADQPEGSFMGEADALGRFRGWFAPPRVERTEQVFGVLLAIKADGPREMYRGATEILGEPLDVALDRHLRQSDQVDAIFRIELFEGGAFGLLVERIASVSDVEERHEQFVEAFQSLRTGPVAGLGRSLADGSLAELPAEVLEVRDVAFRCRCSARRVEGMLLGLGEAELRDMLAEDGGAEVRCHFCNEAYRFDGDGLRRLIVEAGADA